MVEHQPSKLRVASSNLVSRSLLVRIRLLLEGLFHANVAQLVEHFHGKEEVTGSSPVIGSISNEVLLLASHLEGPL